VIPFRVPMQRRRSRSGGRRWRSSPPAPSRISEHELCHLALEEWLHDRPSRILWGLAHGAPLPPHECAYEELAAQALQRFVRAAERPIVGGVDWDALRAFTLAKLEHDAMTRTTVGLVAGILILLFLAVTLGPAACQKIRSQAAQSKLDREEAGAFQNSAADAIQTQSKPTSASGRPRTSAAPTRRKFEMPGFGRRCCCYRCWLPRAV
jgi:hypothetical protein